MADADELDAKLRDDPHSLLADFVGQPDGAAQLRNFLTAGSDNEMLRQRAESLLAVADQETRPLIKQALEAQLDILDGGSIKVVAALAVLLAASAGFFGVGPVAQAVASSSFRSYGEGAVTISSSALCLPCSPHYWRSIACLRRRALRALRQRLHHSRACR